ncbi:MAG TPA: NAD(P)H-dependent oxidoreductase [Gemmatimonadaceae bacterium]|nr:NAD(P)H-dependent oxidoreductase [Gemmatimonadaceae bacterium]
MPAGTPSPVRVLAISGSLRRASSNGAILRAAIELAPAGVVVELYDGLATLPHFNPDLDRTLDDPLLPSPVRALRAAIGSAHALLISSPEYAHGVPGSLKNALDWLVGGSEIVDKPVALWNTAPHATHAQASLAETLRTMSVRLVAEADLSLSLGGRDHAQVAADPALAARLVHALDALRRAAASP